MIAALAVALAVFGGVVLLLMDNDQESEAGFPPSDAAVSVATSPPPATPPSSSVLASTAVTVATTVPRLAESTVPATAPVSLSASEEAVSDLCGRAGEVDRTLDDQSGTGFAGLALIWAIGSYRNAVVDPTLPSLSAEMAAAADVLEDVAAEVQSRVRLPRDLQQPVQDLLAACDDAGFADAT